MPTRSSIRVSFLRVLGYMLFSLTLVFFVGGILLGSLRRTGESLKATKGLPWYNVTDQAVNAFFSNPSIVVVLVMVILYLLAKQRARH